MPQCVALQNLGSDVPGLQHRMVPNWNGYQAEPDSANPGQLKLVLRTPNGRWSRIILLLLRNQFACVSL